MKRIVKIIGAVSILVSSFMIGCVNGLYLEDEPVSAKLNNITGIKSRAVLMDLNYSGGSMLYNPSDLSCSHLTKGAVIATRAGRIGKRDLGNGNYSFCDPVYAADFGYIEITDIDSEYVSFDYYASDGWKEGEEVPSKRGSYTLALGKSVDLTGNGTPDIKYEKPFSKRAGAENSLWLSVINEPDTSGESFMFSILPDQYKNKSYPGGLVNMNESGRYVVTKYNVNSTNRAAVKSISYGDYVIDMQDSSFQLYTGTSSYRSARAVDDAELKTVDVREDNDETAYFFKPEEFGGDYSINELFGKLPKTLVSEGFESKNISELTDELNRFLVNPDLWRILTDGETGESAVAVRENAQKLAPSTPALIVLFNRVILSELYNDSCPAFNVMGTTFAEIFQNFSLFLGDIDIESVEGAESASGVPESSRSAARFIYNTYGDSSMEGHTIDDFRRAMRALEIKQSNYRKDQDFGDNLNLEYRKYCEKKDMILKEFNGLKFSYDFADLAKAFISSNFIQELLKNVTIAAKIGVGGQITITTCKVDITIKIYTLAQFELTDDFQYSVCESIFTKKEPFYIAAADGVPVSEADMKREGFSKEKIAKTLEKKDKEIKKGLGIDHWYMPFKQENERYGDFSIRPTVDALSTHKSVNLSKTLPLVFTFDAKFDVLLKIIAAIKFDEGYIGGLYMAGFQFNAGADWDYINAWLPIVGTFPIGVRNFRSHAGDTDFIAVGASYVGLKTNSITNVRLGGAISALVIPVATVRPGIGIGKNLQLAQADVTGGMTFTFAVPLEGTITVTATPFKDDLDLKLESECKATFCARATLDIQAHVSVLKIFKKDWKWNLFDVADFEMLLGRVKVCNFEIEEAEGPRIITAPFGLGPKQEVKN